MKVLNTKIPALIISALTMILLSGCGSSGTPSDTRLVQGTIDNQAPYVIDTHHGSTAVVHSHVDPSVTGTHQWTQISGPAVTITNPTNQTATIPIPSTATTPIVVQHTHTDTQAGQTTNTQHTITPVPATSALSVIVSKAEFVLQGEKASLHASASGGTAPYTYVWQQTQGTTVILDETHPSAPTFIVPRPTASGIDENDPLIFKVRVLDSAGAEVSAEETIVAVAAFLLIDAPIPLREVDNSIQGPGHSVSRGPISITNPLPGETYDWKVSDLTVGAPPLTDLDLSINADTLTADVDFKSPDVNVETIYGLRISVKDSTGKRLGFVETQITVKPSCLQAAGYGTVTLSNGQVWLDRNIGAIAVGDYGDFMTASIAQNSCPCGFVLPTIADTVDMRSVDYSALNFSNGGLKFTGVLNDQDRGFYFLESGHTMATKDGVYDAIFEPATSDIEAVARCIDPSSRVAP